MKISVALAAFNGEDYIESQLESVLSQLRMGDEVVISDDSPNSKMSNLIKNMSKNDARIKYVEGPCKGVIKNFENAIKNTTGDVIFLCDQDDVWLDDKVKSVMREIENGADLVLHDAIVTDNKLNIIYESFFINHNSKSGFLNNIIKNSYMGCCMAFKSKLKDDILPFPKGLPMHDQWIGLVAEKKYKVKFLNKPLIFYRRHDKNVTGGKTKFKNKIEWRANLCKNLFRK